MMMMMMEEEEDLVMNQGRHEDDKLMMALPPGFRFHPTDEEIITYYLTEKVVDGNFTATAIGEADLNKSEPWDLPNKAKMGEVEWYFFCQRDRKYPTGMRTNRATESGYWKATGKDKEIFKGKALVGMKKTLVFYTGRAPKGEKTNWVMHEYRLHGRNFSTKDEWVVCRVFHKNMGLKKTTSPLSSPVGQGPRLNSFGNDFLDSSTSSLPPLMDPDYGEHKKHAVKGNITAAAPLSIPPSANTNITPADLQYYFQDVGSSTRQMINSFQLPNASGSKQTMSFPQIRHGHQLIPNPSFSFHPNNNLDYYLRQEIRGPNNQDSAFNFQNSATDHQQAILRAKAAAKHNETSVTTAGSSGQCKVEQYSSNQSMFSVSQDTGLSTTEITSSSVVSKQEIEVGSSNTLYEDYLESPSVAPISEIEGLWDYY